MFDAWFNIDWDSYGGNSEPESEEDEDTSEVEEEEEEEEEETEEKETRADDFIDHEGWSWIGVFQPVSFWVCEDNAGRPNGAIRDTLVHWSILRIYLPACFKRSLKPWYEVLCPAQSF